MIETILALSILSIIYLASAVYLEIVRCKKEVALLMDDCAKIELNEKIKQLEIEVSRLENEVEVYFSNTEFQTLKRKLCAQNT